MMWTDDPVRDAENYYNEMEERLQKLPVCECCGNPIQEEYAYLIYDSWYCPDCMRDNFLTLVPEED